MSEAIDLQARQAAQIALRRAEEAALTGGAAGTGDLDIQPDVTGATLTVDTGKWYPLTNATSCAVTLDGTLADERSALVEARAVPSGNYTLTAAAGFSLNGVSQGSVNLAKFIGANATIVRAGTDFRVSGSTLAPRDFGNAVVKRARSFYDELSGAQSLSDTVAPSSCTLANTGSAATWTLPSRVASATGSADSVQVIVHNFGSGAITFSASGPTLVGASSLAANASATVEWCRKGTGTERVVVRTT